MISGKGLAANLRTLNLKKGGDDMKSIVTREGDKQVYGALQGNDTEQVRHYFHAASGPCSTVIVHQ